MSDGNATAVTAAAASDATAVLDCGNFGPEDLETIQVQETVEFAPAAPTIMKCPIQTSPLLILYRRNLPSLLACRQLDLITA